MNFKRIMMNFLLLAVFIALMTGVSLLFSAEIKFNAANRFIKNGQWEKAETAFHEVLATVPFSSAYFLGYGDFLWDRSDAYGLSTPWPLIEKAYAQAISLNPLDAEGWIKLGQIQLDKNDVEAASASFRKALALDPHGTDTAYWMEEYRDYLKE